MEAKKFTFSNSSDFLIFNPRHLKEGQTLERGMLQTESPRQNQSVDSLTRVPGIARTQFETKIKPPRQAQEWSSSSHQESIGKVLSSPGIRSNKKTHINCGSSARMAGNVCANVNQIRRQGRWNNTTMEGISHQPSKRNDAINGDHDVQEDFYTRLGAYDGTPPLPSHLTTFNLL
ncbi:hypothetical protein [Absidia glauca]|uniref:Ndc10 domain-containing protein n=1 Tax=Absidia glauca TaxID=4829 RepID=A0A163JH78_ABSGL|nr:hypothetical protein [Absidia glauca]